MGLNKTGIFVRAIDKGSANSKVGLVLVTLETLERLPKECVADRELVRNRLVPIVDNTKYDASRDVNPLLASRSGLDS